MRADRYHFSTRDLLMMAALAALGGVTGTYLSAAGSLIQAAIGMPGSLQWAAGLHVLWLVLAVGLTGKQGAGTVTGILKGAVELFAGSTHGLLVVLVDLVAGILVDVGFVLFRGTARGRDRLPAYLVAGGLASASNVFVFQLFASLPADVLSYAGIALAASMAGLSGVVFAGLLGHMLVSTLRRSGVVKDREPRPMGRKAYPIFLIAAALLAVGLTLHLRNVSSGGGSVQVGGAVAAPYAYPQEHSDLAQVTAEGTQNNVTARYTGIPLRDLVARAEPSPGASKILIQAADGYGFFVSMDELETNTGLLLASQGRGRDATYNVVGATSSKAWVRGVISLTVISETTLEIGGALAQPGPFDPADWVTAMDSITIKLAAGPSKVQGAPLGEILTTMTPSPDATTVLLNGPAEPVTLSLADVLASDDVRLFTVIHPDAVTFAVARMDGTILAEPVTSIEVR